MASVGDINIPANSKENLLKILAVKLIFKANAKDKAQFFCLTQLDIEELENYNQAMSETHASQWS